MARIEPPSPTLYFPVQVPLRLPGPFYDLSPSSPGGARFLELDRERPAYLRIKQEVLAQPGRGPLRQTGAGAERAIVAAERWLRERLQTEYPELFSTQELANDDLDALMLRVQEDLVVLQRSADLPAKQAPAVYLNVCLPSHWDPQRMLGKNFIGFHARVPYEEGFGKRERADLAGTLFDRPRVRFVWGLSPDALLDQHPDREPRASWRDASRGYLRVERQVVVPLHASPAASVPDTCLFFIRPYHYPLECLDEAQRSMLREAVHSMSDAMRHYKGIAGHEERVLALLV